MGTFVPQFNFLFQVAIVKSSYNNDFLKLIVPKAHNNECRDLLFPLKIKPVKVS